VEHLTEHLKECPICGSKKQKLSIKTRDYFLSQEEFNICECQKCGFQFTNPRPVKAALAPYYKSEEYISHSNSNQGLIGFLYQRVRNYTLRKKYQLITSYKSGDQILDIGCATGQFLNEFKRRGWSCTGIEPDETARKFAHDKFGLKTYDEDQIANFEDHSFDVISMWHVLEHVANLEDRVKELKRLIKDNGCVFIALPNIDSWDAKHYKEYWAGFDVPRHLYHFRKEDVENLFINLGFKMHQILPMKFDAFYVSLLSEKYKKNSLYLFSAFFKAMYSNFKASKQRPNHSSLLYVLKPRVV
jgi:2-polyprenyl-3-methyl-5-hydroxy-6-metoxy-1,4-benzoquinol methylase